jgi:hypothetical protein
MSAGAVNSVSQRRKWLLYKPESNQAPRWWVLALFAAWAFFIGIHGIADRLLISVDGTIISSNTTAGIRPVTYYKIRGLGSDEQAYVAGPMDESLPRRMPVGTYIRKSRYEFSYSKDRQVINDFPLGVHLFWLGIGAVFAWKSFSWWKKGRAD